MINCCTPAVVGNTSPSSFTGDYLSVAQKQAVAPFLYGAGLTPTVNTASGTGALTTKFHHDNAHMAQSIQSAERVHLNSLLAHS